MDTNDNHRPKQNHNKVAQKALRRCPVSPPAGIHSFVGLLFLAGLVGLELWVWASGSLALLFLLHLTGSGHFFRKFRLMNVSVFFIRQKPLPFFTAFWQAGAMRSFFTFLFSSSSRCFVIRFARFGLSLLHFTGSGQFFYKFRLMGVFRSLRQKPLPLFIVDELCK